MKFKRLFIIIFLLFISLIVINSSVSVEDNNETKIEIKNDLNDKNKNMIIIYDPYYGGGVVPGSIGGIYYGPGTGMGGTSGGSGGGVVASIIALSYSVSEEGAKFFNSLDTNSYKVESANPTIDDVLANPGIKKAMDEYKWDEKELIQWLETMLTTSCDKFLNDNEIEVYLGASDYETKYYAKRDANEEHTYAFHTDDSTWAKLVKESEEKVSDSKKYDRIWVLNMAFLQLAIIKNVTFVLVTPTKEYYDYEKHEEIVVPGKPIRFYSKELKYIHAAGYEWKNFNKPNERARKG